MSTTNPEGGSSSSSRSTSSRGGTARRNSTKRAPANKSTRQQSSASAGDGQDLSTAVLAAMRQFAELTGRSPEAVTGARALDEGDGWSVLVDVVELERIPSSTDVLATYRVDLDGRGSITSYERLRRYTRGATDTP